jgi:putative ABC transport system ATP-binding protein
MHDASPNPDAVLTVESLRKAYPSDGVEVRALDSVSLHVRAGEFVAIMGASGSGKSTLLHLVAGLDAPTSGSIMIGGSDLARMGDRERTVFRRRRIGVVFQAYNLLPTLNAVENVALPALLDGRDPRDADARARDLLDLVDMGHRLTHRPQALSGGEQQRVAIARALINEPALVLADEPTGNVDSRHAAAIWGLLARLVGEAGSTVVAVTHEASGATYADRVVMLKDGCVVGEIQPGGRDHAGLVAARYTELVG